MAMLCPRSVLALSLLGGLLWAEPALASGFATARFGGEHGNPITSNATAVYYNPAGIAESEGVHIFLDGSLAFRSATWTHELAETDDDSVPGANDGEATLFNVLAAPMLGASFKIADFALGAGVYVPFGGQASWDKNSDFEGDTQYPGPVDGVQRWSAIDGSIQSMFFTLAAAYRIRAIGLSVGASGNLIRSAVKTLRAREVTGGNTLASEGRSLLDVSGLQASFGVGAMLEAMREKLWIGASYQARPNIAGGMELTGTLRNNFTGTPDPETRVSLYQDLPDIIRLGVRFKAADDLELRLFGDLTRWSAMKNQCLANEGEACAVTANGAAAEGTNPIVNLARDWHDAFGVRAGLSYWPAEEVELFSGVGYDSNAVPDGTLDPSLTDFDDISVALGGRFAIGGHLHLGASYTHLFYVQRDTTGDSILAQKEFPTKVPDSGGIYTQTIGVLNVNLDIGF
jgi:long-chain fatty acid transport protein